MEKALAFISPKDPDRGNLEELFTLLDLADRHAEIPGLADIKWRVIRPCVIGMITEAFLWQQHEFESRLRAGGEQAAARVLQAWTDYLQAGDTIITFNWDVLQETALWRAHKWHYADGYGFASSDAPRGMRSAIKILKLHGSVNWARAVTRDREPTVEYKDEFFAPARDTRSAYADHRSQPDRGRSLVIPTYLKDVTSDKLLLGLWNQAAEVIADATVLTIIGFQLNPADVLARHLIASAVLRNARLSKMSFVLPGWEMDTQADFCRNLGRGSEHWPMTFEEWISKQSHLGVGPAPRG